MKVNLLKINSMRATALLILSTFFAINVMAQNTSVSITVNQVPVLTVGDDAPDAVCPEVEMYANGDTPTGSYSFDIPTLAGVTATPSTGVTYEYAECTDADGTDANWETLIDEEAYLVTASTTASVTKYIAVRAYMESVGTTPCYTDVQVITLVVKQIPVITITGDPTVCGGAVATYGINTTVTDYLWTIIPGTDGGTGVITGGTTATPTITWAENTSDEALSATLQLVYTVDECEYTVTQVIQISPRAIITTTDIGPLCYDNVTGTVDLTAGVAVDGGNTANVTYSVDADFTTTITDPANYPVPATGLDAKTIYVKIGTGDCEDKKQFTVTVHPQITANLVLVVDEEEQEEYEACANSDGTTPTTVTMELTIGGGCPTTGDNHSYLVVLNNTLVDTDGNAIAIDLVSGATISGNTLTIPVAEGAASVTVTLTVDIPATGGTGSVEVDTVTQTGTEPCDCTRSTWN